jgi:hypothetical protein
LNATPSLESPAEPTHASTRMPALWIVAAAVFLLEIPLSAHTLVGFPGPDRYFAYQWSVSYAYGLSRRGLLGESLRLLHLDNGNYLLIAALGWAITVAIFYLLARSLMRLLSPLEPLTRTVLFAVLLLSPLTTAILVATTADPIQFIVLLYLLLTLLFIKPGRNPLLVTFAFLVFGVVSVLVHEASLFFIGPLLLISAFLLRRTRLDRLALIGYLLGAAPLLLATIHFTEAHAATAIAPMHLGNTPLIANEPIHLGTFSSLLTEENTAHFHNGVHGYVLTLRNAIGALTLPLFFALVLSRLLPAAPSSRRIYLTAFLLPIALSTPLWLIAHDWGRFTSYLFMLTLAALSLYPAAISPAATTQPIRSQALLMGILLILSGVVSSRMLPHYVIKGIGDDDYTMLAILLLCAFGLYALLREPHATETSH